MNERRHRLLITCEHGGHRIPRRYRSLLVEAEPLLPTHRGYDRGALTLARALASATAAPLLAASISRLLVDLNRSINHPRLHGEPVRHAARAVRDDIVARYYRPYRSRAERFVGDVVADGHSIVHISCHSFTPELDGVVRNADIGLLYDPARPGEKALCAAWRSAMRQLSPDFKVRFNYPYAGTSDGLTAHLRRLFDAEHYIGVELEINQRLVGHGAAWRRLRGAVIGSLQQALPRLDEDELSQHLSQRSGEVAHPLQEHLDRQDAQDEAHQPLEGGHDPVAEILDKASSRQQDDDVHGHRQR